MEAAGNLSQTIPPRTHKRMPGFRGVGRKVQEGRGSRVFSLPLSKDEPALQGRVQNRGQCAGPRHVFFASHLARTSPHCIEGVRLKVRQKPLQHTL